VTGGLFTCFGPPYREPPGNGPFPSTSMRPGGVIGEHFGRFGSPDNPVREGVGSAQNEPGVLGLRLTAASYG
jgi:hypothetical protein